MGHEIATLMDSLLELLRPLKDIYPRLTVRDYQEELDIEDAKRLAGLAPALLAVYAGSSEAGQGQRRAEAMSFSVVVLAKSYREGEARRGGPDQPGAYALLDSVRTALSGRQLFPDVGPLARTRQGALAFGSGLAVYAATYTLTQYHLP